MALPVFILVAALTLVVLVVLVVSLGRQITRLAQSLGAFQQELQPILDDIRNEAGRAGDRGRAYGARRAQGG